MEAAGLMHYNWVDYAIIVVVMVSTLISLVRGFVREALSLAAWVLALWVAYEFSRDFSTAFQDLITTPSLRMAVSFGILFVCVLLITALVNFVLSKIIAKAGLNGTDRTLGLIFGFSRGILVVTLMVMLGRLTVFVNDKWWQQSVLIPHFDRVANVVREWLPEDLDKYNIFKHHEQATDAAKPAAKSKAKPKVPAKPQTAPSDMPSHAPSQSASPASVQNDADAPSEADLTPQSEIHLNSSDGN